MLSRGRKGSSVLWSEQVLWDFAVCAGDWNRIPFKKLLVVLYFTAHIITVSELPVPVLPWPTCHFNQYLMSVYCVPEIVADSSGKSVGKTPKFCLLGTCILVGRDRK